MTVSVQWEPKKADKRKNVCYMQYRVPYACLNCLFCYIGKTSQQGDEWEKQHKRCIKNQHKSNVNSLWVHLKYNPDFVIEWDKASCMHMAFDSHHSHGHRRMKESFLIDIFPQITWNMKFCNYICQVEVYNAIFIAKH